MLGAGKIVVGQGVLDRLGIAVGDQLQIGKSLFEIADVIPFMKGINWDRLGKNGLQWPVLEDGTDTQIIHKDGNFKRGKMGKILGVV